MSENIGNGLIRAFSTRLTGRRESRAALPNLTEATRSPAVRLTAAPRRRRREAPVRGAGHATLQAPAARQTPVRPGCGAAGHQRIPVQCRSRRRRVLPDGGGLNGRWQKKMMMISLSWTEPRIIQERRLGSQDSSCFFFNTYGTVLYCVLFIL